MRKRAVSVMAMFAVSCATPKISPPATSVTPAPQDKGGAGAKSGVAAPAPNVVAEHDEPARMEEDTALPAASLPPPAPEAKEAVLGKPAAEPMGSLADANKSAPAKPKARQRTRRKVKPAPPPPKPVPPETPTTQYLSADDSNSAASPVIARRMIERGRYVQPQVVRTYEFLNYYSFDYPAPAQGTIAVYPQLRRLEADGEYSLQVAVRGPDRALGDLSPLNVVLLLDVSGSMAGEPFRLAKRFLLGFVGKMRSGDTLSLVTVNREARVLLESHGVDRRTPALLDELLGSAEVADITDLEKGVVEAYEVAGRTYDAQALNRIVLLSDGADNAGKKAVEVISNAAADSDRQGIYLAGVGFGEGFNDYLMDSFTDRGRGAYLFIDNEAEVDHALADERFVASFDLAAKDIRLKAVLPAHWMVKKFHGEQMSARKADVIPQYLSPNDQMIYHMTLYTDRTPEVARDAAFEFEAEYRPLGGKAATVAVNTLAAAMLKGNRATLKGDAIVAYAEMLKQMQYPLAQHKESNLEVFDRALAQVKVAQRSLDDNELADILALLRRYRRTVEFGVRFVGNRDKDSDAVDAVLGLSANTVDGVEVNGVAPSSAVKALERLGNSTAVLPLEGYKFLVLSSGPVWNPSPSGSGQLSGKTQPDPTPTFLGRRKVSVDQRPCYDLHRVTLRLQAPRNARSFSFDFNFFSAEYPSYINQNFNDTFYATLEAPSTNRGQRTNISFDANNNSIEVDNNYFQQPFHPVPNTGTGFDAHGSTGWLRTSWPIRGGEEFTLSFTIHDEGDGVFDSLVVLDNFQWHDFEAAGTTDPLN